MKQTVTILTALFVGFLGCNANESWEPAGDKIKTRWAAEVSPENVHPEYPRPQMIRQEAETGGFKGLLEKCGIGSTPSAWVNLNGLWDYAISPKDIVDMPQAEGQILVPFCVESSLSGVGRRVGIDNVLWYKTTITKPEGWEGKDILLHFDAVDWYCEVYADGELLGSHSGGYVPFSYNLSQALSDGSAEICVKVWDPSDDPSYSIPRGKQVSKPEGIWYTPVTGIWQSVWLEAVPVKGYIKDYNVVTDIHEGSLKVDVDCHCAQPGDQVKLTVLRPKTGYDTSDPGWRLFGKAKATAPAGQSLSVSLKDLKLWTPDQPYLYGLEIALVREGKTIDKVQAYTAFREVASKTDEYGTKRLTLNDEILFQFGPLDQGWWPDGLYTAPTAEAMAFDIVKTKELGFNMLRKHIKVEPSRYYYDCDREGIMVWQDMPSIGYYNKREQWGQGEDCYGAGTDHWVLQDEERLAAKSYTIGNKTIAHDIKANYYKEWTEVMTHLKKFQSIVMWVPFNEAWGQFDTKAVADYTKLQDPARLVNAASGGNWIKGAGDILDTHTYPSPRMRIIDPEMINVLGEYGGIGYPMEGHLWEEGRNWGYIQFESTDDVTDMYETYINDLIDIKQLDRCAAAIYTQTTDVEIEVNGFYTYDRECLKMDVARVRKANLSVIEAPLKPQIALVSPYNFHRKDPEIGGGHANLYKIQAGDLTMQLTTFGARVISLYAPDKEGNLDDVVVGYDDIERFYHNTGERFLGATVGRVANRIGGGSFTLDGKEYKLPKNNNGQTLHGGLKGVDMLMWKLVSRTPSSVTLKCRVPDGMDGFPGNLDIVLTYTLTEDNELDIKYEATCDKATPVNLSNHAFYNLHGSKGGSILDHVLTLPASGITPVDKYLIPTGEIMPVEGTPFDFREPHAIGERVGEDHIQLVYGGGYDHNWVLDHPSDGSLHKVCELYEAESGRVMEVFSDQPGIQFYCGNFFDGSYAGKNGVTIGYREALALETQKFPDAVHHPQFPDTILRSGEKYSQHTIYKFSVK